MLCYDPVIAQALDVTLVAWWKALLILIPFAPWGWLVSVVLDKDARYFHLNHRMWNAIHLGAGAAALATMLLVPIFWIGWPVGMLILVGPLVAYWQLRNREVPDEAEFHFTSEGVKARLERMRQGRADRAAVIHFVGPAGERATPQKDDPKHPVHLAIEDLIVPALDARASRVEMAIGPNGAIVTQVVDGVRYKRESIPADTAMRMLDYLKEMADLDVADRRRRQDVEFKMHGPRGENRLAITTSGSSAGQTLRIDFDRSDRLSKPFDGLGLLPSQLEQFRPTLEKVNRHGIILIGAPPGQGLSTSAYAFLNRHDAYTSNVKTLEREVLVDLEGIDQQVLDPSNPDVDYATHLQSILRRDPDVVLTAEIRDSESARIAAGPGLDGPLIYVPQRLGTIVEQIRLWVKQVGDVKRATGGLTAVTNQRLLRSVCPNCRQAYQPSPEQLKKLGIPADRVKQLFRAGGKVQVKNKIETCPVCNGTGYLGQTAAFEVFIVDPEIRRILATGDLKAALAQARRNKMIYLQEAALSKVIAGETTLDEVVRVITSRSAEGHAQPKPAA